MLMGSGTLKGNRLLMERETVTVSCVVAESLNTMQNVSQGRICLDACTCCHTEVDLACRACCYTQSQYTDIGPTRPSADPIDLMAWQGSHRSSKFQVIGMTR